MISFDLIPGTARYQVKTTYFCHQSAGIAGKFITIREGIREKRNVTLEIFSVNRLPLKIILQ